MLETNRNRLVVPVSHFRGRWHPRSAQRWPLWRTSIEFDDFLSAIFWPFSRFLSKLHPKLWIPFFHPKCWIPRFRPFSIQNVFVQFLAIWDHTVLPSTWCKWTHPILMLFVGILMGIRSVKDLLQKFLILKS